MLDQVLSGESVKISAGKDEKTFPGFGIGLSIVNEIIKLHDGKIWAKSEKDKGSVFYVSLPVNN
ncbi:MAG: ATP-binding protein [Bacteroidota bacterium]